MFKLVDGSLLVVTRWEERKKKANSCFHLTRAVIPFWGAPPSFTNDLPKASLPNTITLGIMFPPLNFGGTQTFSPNLFRTNRKKQEVDKRPWSSG